MATDEGGIHTALLVEYRQLEEQMRKLAKADGDVYLPNVEPLHPVDFIFICLEPSLGRWAKTREEANSKISSGFRNFIDSIDDMILHHSIRTYLCREDQSYHLTDVSKGAMLVEKANMDRKLRYAKWHDLLMKNPRPVFSRLGKRWANI